MGTNYAQRGVNLGGVEIPARHSAKFIAEWCLYAGWLSQNRDYTHWLPGRGFGCNRL